jgi:hypothetical protein
LPAKVWLSKQKLQPPHPKQSVLLMHCRAAACVLPFAQHWLSVQPGFERPNTTGVPRLQCSEGLGGG